MRLTTRISSTTFTGPAGRPPRGDTGLHRAAPPLTAAPRDRFALRLVRPRGPDGRRPCGRPRAASARPRRRRAGRARGRPPARTVSTRSSRHARSASSASEAPIRPSASAAASRTSAEASCSPRSATSESVGAPTYPSTVSAVARSEGSGCSAIRRSSGTPADPSSTSAWPATPFGSRPDTSCSMSGSAASTIPSRPRLRAAEARTSRRLSSSATRSCGATSGQHMSPSRYAASARRHARREPSAPSAARQRGARPEVGADPRIGLPGQLARVPPEHVGERRLLGGGERGYLHVLALDQRDGERPDSTFRLEAPTVTDSELDAPHRERDQQDEAGCDERDRDRDQRLQVRHRRPRIACTRELSSCGLNGLRM